MKKISKINPIAKQLRRLGKQVVPDKRRDKEDKRLTKETRDAKTQQDSWAYENLQSTDETRSIRQTK